MYTNQCFAKYPHFQLADLNDGKKYSNNANKFRSYFGKGKQGKGKEKGREANTYRDWRNGNKGKRGNPENKGSRYNHHGQTYTQNSNQTKGKGNAKGFKAKGKGKGKPRYGDRKNDHNEKGNQESEKKQATNNMQKVYLENHHCLGDDETTIVFTQNVTRIVANTIIEREEMGIASCEVNEYERLSLELAPAFIKMIREMTNLPDNHFAWSYMNPTRYHLGNQTPYEDLIQEDQHKRDFEHWLDGILFLHQELKERKKDDHLQSSPNDKAAQDEKIDKRSFNDKKEEEQGS